MQPLGKALTLLLVFCAAWPLCGQTLPPTEPYELSGRGRSDWPDHPRQPADPLAPDRVLQASYLAERRETGPPPSGGSAGPAAGGSGAANSFSAPGRGLPLPPRGSNDNAARPNASGGLPSALSVGSSLAVVLGLFLLLAWALRRAAPGESAVLPAEVVEVLGRKVVAQRQQLQLLRCGRKLLLIVVTPDGAETLTEITDPLEVERLAGLCRQGQSGSATTAFRHVLREFSSDRREDRHA